MLLGVHDGDNTLYHSAWELAEQREPAHLACEAKSDRGGLKEKRLSKIAATLLSNFPLAAARAE